MFRTLIGLFTISHRGERKRAESSLLFLFLSSFRISRVSAIAVHDELELCTRTNARVFCPTLLLLLLLLLPLLFLYAVVVITRGAALLPEPADVRVVSHPPLLIVEPKLSEHVADFID